MIKYIVTWVLLKTIPTACPDATTTDKFGRVSNSYVSCAVYHVRYEKERLNKEFYSKDSANAFYNELLIESKKTTYFSSNIDSIEIISCIETNKKIGCISLDSLSRKYKNKAEKAAKEADKHFKLN